jgi:hypothetical protein
MTTQILTPDAIVSSSLVSGATTSNLAAQDANWVTATANNVNSEVRVSFDTPTLPPDIGANLQTITVQARKQGGSGTPSFVIELYETGGSSPLASSASQNVSSTSGATYTLTWNASLLGTASGSNVEVRVITSSVGGNPSTRASIDYGYIAWTASYTPDTTAPTITSTNTASVNENAQLNKPLSANETVTWSLSGGADISQFELNGSNLRWFGNSQKDYENPTDSDGNNQYVVTVRATDASSNFTDQTITVSVTDIVPPQFTSTPTTSVAENSVLAYVINTDSPGATLSIIGGTDASKFELSGSLSGSTLRWAGNGTKNFEAPDDADSNNVYNVTLQATLAGESDQQAYSITVTDIATPSFTSASAISNVENSVLSHTLSVASGSPAYAIVGGADQAKFEISGSTLRWASNGTKDYEAPDDADGNNIYVVTVRATTSGETADQTISVTVTNSLADDDLTAPTITSSATVSVAENATLSHGLTADEAAIWSITGGADSAKFELSGSTLRWAGNTTKNYEAPDDADANNAYVVQVTATDASNNASNQTITVTVTNVTPTITSSASPTVNENSTLSHALTVSSGTPTWSIVGGNDQAQFQLSGSTLQWSSNGTRNYEAPADANTDNVYNVIVRATVSGESTDQTVNVTVLDLPTPIINSSASITVAENAILAHALTTSTGSPSWSITGGTDSAKFQLTGSTLQWASNGTKNYEAPDDADANNIYVVTVQANVSGETSTQTINVTVTNVFEAASLNALTGSLSVDENTANLPLSNGSVVGTPTGYTSGSTRTLSDNAGGRFAINSTTGQITVVNAALLNYETNSSHSITVVETLADSANSPRSTVLTITVNDVDETPPTIVVRAQYRIIPRKGWSISLAADKAVSWDKTGGADSADFTLIGSTLTLGPKSPRATSVVQITATDAFNNQTVQTFTVNTIKARRRSRGY